ncbi:MAG: 2-oxoacid:ferredoxin oxidoreductase subunit beta [bacterium]|nr:2-oxoacid:ferredoxin oxidoreductase subunit beta [bacterium]
MAIAVDNHAVRESFVNAIKPIWCAGCGDFYVLAALSDSLVEQGLRTHEVAVVSGIGCSSRLPGYMSCYGFNSIHGRAVPIATGLKLARPDITVVCAAGDGDAFSIGGGHLIHGVRRDVDITYIVMDNGIYGLTKGQASPTTPRGAVTKTSEGGANDMPVNPLELMLTYGAGFVAQAYAADQRGMQRLFVEAMAHRGFSYVNVISPCPTFRGGMGIYKDLRQMLSPLKVEEHDVADFDAAMQVARDVDKLYTGVLYKRPERADSEQRNARTAEEALALAEQYK